MKSTFGLGYIILEITVLYLNTVVAGVNLEFENEVVLAARTWTQLKGF